MVRGEDVGADDEIYLTLVGGASPKELATVVSDGLGHFSIAVEISTEAPAGTYAIKASGRSGIEVTAALSIAGPPITDQEAGAPVGQDEGLPAIVPSAGLASTPAPMDAVQPSAGVTSTTASDVDLVPFVGVAGAIGALGLLVWRTRRSPLGSTRSADLS